MNILNEISIDYLTDSKVLCETPAKLKLREKTLKGINYNLSNENTLPGMMLAKKRMNKEDEKATIDAILNEVNAARKNKIKQSEPIVQQVDEQKLRIEETKKDDVSLEIPEVNMDSEVGLPIVEMQPVEESEIKIDEQPVGIPIEMNNESTEKIIEDTKKIIQGIVATYVDKISGIEGSKKIKLSSNEYQRIEEKGLELMKSIDEVMINEVPEIKPEVVEEVTVDNIPIVENVPIINEESIVSEQNDKSVLMGIEDKKQVPTLDEVREKMSAPVIDVAVNDNVVSETSKLRDEVMALKNAQQENRQKLQDFTSKYNSAVNIANELEKNCETSKKEATEAERMFKDALEQQRKMLDEMKLSILRENESSATQIKDLNEKTAQIEQDNMAKEEEIKAANDKAAKYKSLLSSLESLKIESMAQTQDNIDHAIQMVDQISQSQEEVGYGRAA